MSENPLSPPPPSRRMAEITIDPSAIAANWRWFDALGPAETAAVVKADAYGLGAEGAARALLAAGARTFFTATLAEARIVRRVIGAEPLLYVLNGPSTDDAAKFAEISARPVLNSLAQIALWEARGPAALHIDTGMNRLGLSLGDVAPAASALAGADIPLVLSHLACASTRDHPMNAEQRAAFMAAAASFPNARLSLAATAGALLGRDFHFDMIRPGLGLYGSGGMDADNPKLSVAARITAPILQLRDVPEGAPFGYGATRKAPRPMRAATVAIGYADGFLRSFGPKGYGVLNGMKLNLLGRVSMDLVILDATDAPGAKVGDKVEFLGEHARLDEIAEAAGSAPYEILTTFAGGVRAARA
ncbi:MAG: alanine racemase [Hyphomonadaceae bacterium]